MRYLYVARQGSADRMTNTKVVERYRARGIEARIMEARLCWAQHVARIANTAHISRFGELEQGTWHVDGPLTEAIQGPAQSEQPDRQLREPSSGEAVDELEHYRVEELKKMKEAERTYCYAWQLSVRPVFSRLQRRLI